MRYGLRTLMIVMGIAPPLLAGAWLTRVVIGWSFESGLVAVVGLGLAIILICGLILAWTIKLAYALARQ